MTKRGAATAAKETAKPTAAHEPATDEAATEQPLVQSAASPTEYDAAARQRIGLVLPTAAGALPVTLIYEPQGGAQAFTDLLREYQRRLAAVPTTITAEAEAEARALAQLDAAAWLFNQTIVDVEGIGAEGEAKPTGWLDYFTPQEKIGVVLNAILSGVPTIEAGLAGARPGWQMLAAAVARLRVLFDGQDVSTYHTLRKADTATRAAFGTLLQQMQDGASAINFMFDLAAIYDKLKESARGYKGGVVPVHHRAFVALAHMTAQAQVARKN